MTFMHNTGLMHYIIENILYMGAPMRIKQNKCGVFFNKRNAFIKLGDMDGRGHF